MEVVRVRWPEEAERRELLARVGSPRLLVLSRDVFPPVVEDPLEDWVRVSWSQSDIQARIDTLARRARWREWMEPSLDDDGVIRHSGSWASLSPVGARMTRLLLERIGAVVSRDDLSRAGWPDGAPGGHSLDVNVLRLRRRLAQVGLMIRTVRARGFILEPGAPAFGSDA